LALCASSAACRTTDSKPRPLPLEIGGDHFVGTIHTGPLAVRSGSESPPIAPWWIEVQVSYVAAPAAEGSVGLSTRTRQVFAERGGEPLRSRSELASGWLCTSTAAEPADEFANARRTDPLWPGTTTLWHLRRQTRADEPSAALWEDVEIQVSRKAGDRGEAAELALVLEGRVVARPESEEGEARKAPAQANEPVLEREHLVLESDPFAGGEPLSIFLPASNRKFPAGGFEIRISRVAPPPGDELAAALERGRSELDASLARAKAGSSRITTAEGFHFESGSALPALDDPRLRRGALAFLAQVTGAELAGDLAIAAEPDRLADFVAELRGRLRGSGADEAGSPSLGWILERSAYAWLAARALDEKHALSPEMSTLLVVHAGELGRFPELLRDAALECDGLPALARRLVDENRIFLEDADPAARLRAFEWLRDRGASPESFDPLGPLAERRAALDRDRAAVSAAVPGAGEKK
jgi:hypothetical protein